jgi:diguanylate cyclase (GGDEF)-like protein
MEADAMHVADDLEVEDTQALRARRLFQIANLSIGALAVGALFYAYSSRWVVVSILVAGILLMLVCRQLSRKGQTDLGNLVLLVSVTAMMSTLMWMFQGLRDAAFLTYPVILIMAGLLVRSRHFFAILLAMLAYMVFLTLATTHWGLRVSSAEGSPLFRLRDSSLILGVGGIAIWIIVNDLRTALERVRLQIGRAKDSQKRLTYLSQHDGLTGLPNRNLGRDRIEQAIVQAQRHQTRVALLFVDLDNFKEVNDTLGHSAGDEFLVEIARRLQDAVRKSDVVCRHGGDEFVIGLAEVLQDEDASRAAAKVMARLNQTLQLKGAELVASCSIGIALYPEDASDYEGLLRKADIAMYQAKESGRNDYRFFDEAMNATIQESLQLNSQMRTGLARQEFVLHFQPVIALDGGALVGAEALVRWQHPVRGLMPPAAFIPAAEKSGFVVELGEWVLREACRQMAAWQAQGLPRFVLAINLSPVQFRRGDIVRLVADALQRSGLDPALLELEITESTLIQDADKFLVLLQGLKSLGVRLSIDDFGTGYSNLVYLQRFNVDKLKIDQSFVRSLVHGGQEQAIVSAIIQMARSLNLSTTAEGIEEAPIQHLLQSLGCECGQGYLIAKPLPAADFALFVAQYAA